LAADSRANGRNALIAGFTGWTLDAFDFFILTFTLGAIAKDFGRSIPAIVLTLTATLAMRPIGAFIFGLMADRYGWLRAMRVFSFFACSTESRLAASGASALLW